MAKNIVFDEANQLSLPVPADTTAGSPVRVGGLNGVTLTDRAEASTGPIDTTTGAPNSAYNWGGGNPDGYATVKLDGAAEFTVAFAVASVGTPVYIVTATNALSDTDNTGANPLFGHALSTKAAASGPLTVRLAN